ncbi:MAG: DUF896 domain-containing protein [Clostridiales bacterium]|nr:DUF896 domain-containing protein [Clostridiales bacterium]
MKHYAYSKEEVMDTKKIARINELAKKAKESGLTPQEERERAELRAQYLAAVRENFRQTLESIEYKE